MLQILSLVAILVSYCCAAPGQNLSFVPNYTLHVTYDVASAACNTKPMGLVNGTSPGPPIFVGINQTTWIRVFNDMPDQNLTMHLLGFGASVNYADGTPLASQWPIAPGQFFDYQIRPNKAGTNFYHSHIDFQGVSVNGPIIVTDNGAPPYAYDGDKILHLTEFYNKTDDAIVAGLTSPTYYQFSGETEAILINGKSYPAVSGEESQTPPPYYTEYNDREATCAPDVIEVEADKTYRFRTIAAQALSVVAFEIEDHDNLTVIAADGEYVLPAYTNMIVAGTGQRYDFLLKTMTSEQLAAAGKTEFWIQFETRLRPTTVTSYAILRYTSATAYNATNVPTYGNATTYSNTTNSSYTPPAYPPSTAPLTIPTYIQDWLEYQLKPLTPAGFPPVSTRTLYLRASQKSSNGGVYWTVNNQTWTPENMHLSGTPFTDTSSNQGTPYLVDIYAQGDAAIPKYNNATNGYDAETNTYVAAVGEILDFVFVNEPNGQEGGYEAHAWHNHGVHMWDLGSGSGAYNPAANNAKINSTFGARGPAKRDATMLYTYGNATSFPAGSQQGWRAIRLRVYGAGVWPLDSHTLQHQIMGMSTVTILGNAAEINQFPSPYVGTGYTTFGGSAYGNTSYDPLTKQLGG